jgi:riboflavin-specific deaminase-like protein
VNPQAHIAARESGGPAGRPFVVVNMAMTADGKIATANRAVASFGSPRDLAHLYALRATAEAVMCGARTAEMDGLSLGPGPACYRRLRRQRGLAEYNLRVLVSGSGSINPRAAIFTRRVSPILILTTEQAGARRLAALRKVADEMLVFGERGVSFAAALAELRARWGVRRLVCEGGGELNAALFAAGLVDELHLTICPFVFGGRDAPSIADGSGVTRLAEAARFELRSCRRHGDELFCVFAAAGRAGGR